jgi:small-conductance mechanosensitive channel
MTMLRTIMLVCGMSMAALATGSAALAQTTPAAPTSAPISPATPVPAADTPNAQQAAQALAVLQDPAKRAEMISVLQTLARAAPRMAASPGSGAGPVPAATPATAASPATAGKPATGAAAAVAAAKMVIPLAPNSLGAELLVDVSGRLESLSGEVSGTVRTLTNFTLLQRWVVGLAGDPESRAELLDAAWKLLAVAAIAIAIEAATKRLLRRARRAMLNRAPSPAPAPATPEPPARDAAVTKPGLIGKAAGTAPPRPPDPEAIGTIRRITLALRRWGLDLLPVLAMATVGYGLLGTPLGEPRTTKLVILALLNAYLLSRLVTVTARAALSPEIPGLRLIQLDEAQARSTLHWIQRLVLVALFGYALTEVGLLFGMYRVVHDALLKLVGLAAYLMLVLIIIQNRAPVARLIRAAPGKSGVFATIRNRVAPVWHFIVIAYIVALWTVWAVEVPGGFHKLLMVFVSIAVVGTAARLLVAALTAWLDQTVTVTPDSRPRSPGFEHTVQRYLPLLRATVHTVVGVVALVLLLQFWGIDSLDWFRGDALGGRLLSAAANSAITIAIGLAVWEGSNAIVQNHLARLAREGQPARSARLRTLLPMMRTTLMVSICLFVGLTVLSQIGVNIAPLLAGAGVVGLAIGFGSQKLVQDIITGLFLLLENTMQVGDVVTLGGLTGTVENLSIRTIRLRALDGAVHIVPFSAVTTVTNLTRDFAYALLDVSIGLNEEPDAIAKIVQDVAEGMRQEPRWAAAITDRMEIMGVEKFIDTAWVFRCRLKTLPSQRWAVARELNRRIKYRFDELAIESPFTSYKALSAALPPPPNAKTVDEPGQAAA